MSHIKHVFFALIILALIGMAILLNSTKVLQWTADRYGPHYHLGYKHISGTLLTGVEIEDLTFKEDKLSDSLKVGLNPFSIFHNRLKLTYLEIDGVNGLNTRKAVEAFVTKGPQKKDHDLLMPFLVDVEKLKIHIHPFKESGVAFEYVVLEGKEFVFDGEDFEMEELSLVIDSNLTSIELNGSMEDKEIKVKNLNISDFDSIAFERVIQKITAANLHEEIIEHVEPEIEDYREGREHLLPKSIAIDSATISVLPADYTAIKFKQVELNTSSIYLDLYGLMDDQPHALQIGAYSMIMDTNLSHISLFGKLENEIATVDLLSIRDMDAIALKNFLSTTDIHQINTSKSSDMNHTLNLLAPKRLQVKHLDISVKEMENSPISIKNAVANATDLGLDIATMTLQSGEVVLSAESRFGSLVQHGVIRDGHIESKGYLRPDQALFEDHGSFHIKEMEVENLLSWENGVGSYKGKITPGRIEGLDANYSELLEEMTIVYEGDTKAIMAQIDSKGLKGNFTSKDFKKGDLTLLTKDPLDLHTLVSLPQELHASQVEATIHLPLNFNALIPLKADINIRSNLVNMDAALTYNEVFNAEIHTTFPEESLLRGYSPKLNLDAFTPLETKLRLADKDLYADIRSKGLVSNVKFNLEDQNITGKMLLGGAAFEFKGNANKKVFLKNSVSSLSDLLRKIHTIYAFDMPPLEGDARISMEFSGLKDIKLKLQANTLTYGTVDAQKHTFSNTMISLVLSDSVLLLNRYHTTFAEQKIFSDKPSVITFKDGNIEVDPLWINNELKINGIYNFKNQEGEGSIVADAFKVLHEKSDVTSRVNIQTKTSDYKTDIQGTITLLDGNIYHEMETKRFSPDSDIVDVKVMKKRESTLFRTNLSTSIKVNTDKPLSFKTDKADVTIDADLMIQKTYQEPLGVLGTIKILDGSSYSISNKKFLFRNSTVNLLGDPFNPFLDITAIYKTRQTEIKIRAVGDLHNPNITFSSTPHMSRKRILSTILFDVQDHTENISEENMLLMMGDSMSKSLFSNIGGETIKYVFSTIGINIDKLPFIGRSWDANQSKDAFLSFFSSDTEDELSSHEIHFKGQKHLTKKQIQKAMGVETKSVWAFWKEDKPKIIDRLLPKLERSLQNFYASEGFYDAKFSIERSKRNVVVNIDENEPVKVAHITIESDYDISKHITFTKGEVFRSKEFVSVKKNIINDLMKDGYCSYDLDSKAYVDRDARTVNIDFKLKKGEVCTFGEVTIKDFETIDASVIMSRIRVKEGDPFSAKQIQETYDALYVLNVFDYISVGHDRKFYNVVPVEIAGSEVKRPWYFSADVDYTSSDGFRLSTEVKRTNFLGNAKNISLDFTFSRIDKSLEMSYFVPALFKVSDYYFDLTSKIGLSEFKYEGFTEEKKYVEMLLGYNDEKWSINAGLAIENINISPRSHLFSQSIKGGTFSPVYPFINLSYDSRDSKMYPKNGYYIEGSMEYGVPYSGENPYFKYSLEGKAIYTFSTITYSAIAKAGIVDYSDTNIPESKLFFAGGFDSNRAYGYKEIGVITSPTTYTIEGAATMANLSLEASYPIGENLYAEIFTDNTMLTKDDYDFSGDIITSAGMGVGYRTPLGQIKLDVGMNVRDPSIYEVNIHIGQSF